MTTHLEKVARTGGPFGSFPARSATARRIVLGSALAVVIALAAIVMSDGTNSEAAPASPAIQTQELTPLANWTVPEMNVAGIEYSPSNPFVQSQAPLADWTVPEMNVAGIEYSPSNPFVQSQAPLANWTVPEMNVAGIEYSPSNPYVQPETEPSARLGQAGPS